MAPRYKRSLQIPLSVPAKPQREHLYTTGPAGPAVSGEKLNYAIAGEMEPRRTLAPIKEIAFIIFMYP